MIRVIVFLTFVALIAFGAVWIVERPGDVAITWQGWRIETSVMVAVVGIAAIGAGAAVADANSNGRNNPQATVSATPATVVMGAAPAQGHFEVINGVSTWVPAGVNYDHDADGVQNHMDRHPNDPSRS